MPVFQTKTSKTNKQTNKQNNNNNNNNQSPLNQAFVSKFVSKWDFAESVSPNFSLRNVPPETILSKIGRIWDFSKLYKAST